MTRITVTGSNGQLGRSVRDIIEGINGSNANSRNIEATFLNRKDLDIKDKERVEEYFSTERCDALINCAAYTNVDGAETAFEDAMLVNMQAVENLARQASRRNFRLIHISTDYVFDGTAQIPYLETDPTAPATKYGQSKLAGEIAINKLARENSVIIRTSWLYSNYGRNFFLTMKERALNGSPVNVVSDQTGTPTLANDLAKVLVEIATSNTWHPGIYHYSSEGEATWFAFAKEIFTLYGGNPSSVSAISTEDFNSKTPRPKYSVLDKTKIKETFGIEIPDWKTSLKRLVNSDLKGLQ